MINQKILRVGIITATSHPVQTIYLPTLQSLPESYQITTIHDASHTLQSDGTVPGTKSSPTVQGVLDDPAVDLVLNFMPSEYHEIYTVAALNAGKHVMVETPVSLSIPSARRILEAERNAPNGARVFVACARRYAPCFEEVFKREVAGLDRIYYARCRMIAGPHGAHTATAPRVGNGVRNGAGGGEGRPKKEEGDEKGRSLLRGLMKEAFGGDDTGEEGVVVSRERMALSRFLASLGCHDLGLVRDTLGYPDAISNISLNEPFYSALFHYTAGDDGVDGGYPFTLMYEAGTDCVPRCDAQLAVYGHKKTVTVHYDLPYAQGQPVRVVVETADERGGLQQTESVSTWEEAYKEELRALHAYLVEGKPVKTTARDGLQDLKLFKTIFEQYDRQCGTIRTPLG